MSPDFTPSGSRASNEMVAVESDSSSELEEKRTLTVLGGQKNFNQITKSKERANENLVVDKNEGEMESVDDNSDRWVKKENGERGTEGSQTDGGKSSKTTESHSDSGEEESKSETGANDNTRYCVF